MEKPGNTLAGVVFCFHPGPHVCQIKIHSLLIYIYIWVCVCVCVRAHRYMDILSFLSSIKCSYVYRDPWLSYLVGHRCFLKFI